MVSLRVWPTPGTKSQGRGIWTAPPTLVTPATILRVHMSHSSAASVVSGRATRLSAQVKPTQYIALVSSMCISY